MVKRDDERQTEAEELTNKQAPARRWLARSDMWKQLSGDKLHVLVLFFLYCLQGIPIGLKDAIPLILTKKGTPYTEQATFSISGYPFSMKVRPSVDSSLKWSL